MGEGWCGAHYFRESLLSQSISDHNFLTLLPGTPGGSLLLEVYGKCIDNHSCGSFYWLTTKVFLNVKVKYDKSCNELFKTG